MKTIISPILFLSSLVCFSQMDYSKAPLYWSVYEYHIMKEHVGASNNYIPESVFLANINWVTDNLSPLGYDMICVDGWGDVSLISPNGYRTSHSSYWQHDFAWWADYLQQQDMNLGMYGNPLWIHVDQNDQITMIVGTDIPVSSLIDADEEASFTWVQVDRPGAEEYVKGYIQYYADMGIKYFRVDFLSWFENGWDRYLGTVGPERPREYYETALLWMSEAANENGMFLSLVMPHLYFEAEAEKMFGNMVRINEDTGEGGWWKWNDKDRGIKREGWSVYANPADGLSYWSYLSGRDSIKLDPDFIRLNTFANLEEKKNVVSMCLLAGGPLTVSDQYNTIGTDLWLYQNTELLELNYDGFVGHPLTNDPTETNSQVWTGQLLNGDWIVGLFNRENNSQTRSIEFSTLGISGDAHIRDLWLHENLPDGPSYSASIPAHACTILKVVPQSGAVTGPDAIFVKELATDIQVLPNDYLQGIAHVNINNSANSPVENVVVSVSFSGSFVETQSGLTDAEGNVTLTTSLSDTGIVKINACVISVNHPDYIYAGDRNSATCVGEHIYYAGTYNNWGLKPLEYSQGWWQKDSIIIYSGDNEMKFANTSDWSGSDWGNAIGLSGYAIESTGGDPNISFTINYGGFFDIKFNDTSHQYFIDENEVRKLNDQIYVAGTFNDWVLTPMSHDGDNWKIENLGIPSGNQELKFANTADWSGDDWGDASGLNGIAQVATGGKPNISFTIPQSDNYTLLFDDITLEYTISNNLSVKSFGDYQLIIYPNPTSGIIHIEHPHAADLSVSVYNFFGQQILGNLHNTSIDISTFENGLYYLRIFDGQQLFTVKIAKVD